MLGLVIYLSSVAIIPQIVLLVTFLIVLYRILYVLDSKIVFDKNEIIGYFFVLMSVIIITIVGIYPGPVVDNLLEGSLLGNFPFLFLISLSIFIGKFITVRDLKIIQYLLFIEILVACYEYLLGINSVFTHLVRDASNGELLYDSRVYGLSANSSVLAIKLLISYMIYAVLKNENSKLW